MPLGSNIASQIDTTAHVVGRKLDSQFSSNGEDTSNGADVGSDNESGMYDEHNDSMEYSQAKANLNQGSMLVLTNLDYFDFNISIAGQYNTNT